MAQEPVSSMEDQLIEEREILRRQIDQLQVEKRNAVDRIRSEYEKQVQDANATVRELRKQLENEQRSSQKLIQQQQEQTQQNIQLKDALTAKERQISQVSMEKQKVVSLLETSQTEIAAIRAKSSQQAIGLQDLNSEIGMLKMQILDARLEVDLAKIGEKNYRAECEQHRATVERLHRDLLEKDKDINQSRMEATQQVKAQLQKVSALEENVWIEKQKHSRYEETIRSVKQTVEEQKIKIEEMKKAEAKREEEVEAAASSYRVNVAKLKDQMEIYNRRIELLESEAKINEKTIEDFQSTSETGLRKAQEEITRLNGELEQQKQSMLDSEAELLSARELTAYLRHDRSRVFSPELLDLVRNENFSVVRLYYEYQRAVNKLTEVEADRERLQEDLEVNQQTYQAATEIEERYQEEKTELDATIANLRSSLTRSENETRQLANTNRTLNQHLYKFERVNRTLEGRIQMLEKFIEPSGFDELHGDASINGRNPAKLIEVNTSLMNINEELNEEIQSLKDEREQWMSQRDQFMENKEKIDSMLNDKEQIDSRIRKLAEEVSQYRRASENPLFKDFLRSLSENDELQKAVIGMSGDERIQYAFIRANGGGEALDRISRLENDLSATKQQFNSVKNENAELKRETESRKAKFDRDFMTVQSERDKALSEVEAVRNGMELVKQENAAKNAEVARQISKVNELFEKLCEREKDMTLLQNALEQEKEKNARTAAELSMTTTDIASRKNAITVLEQQQAILQRSIEEKSLALQSSQQKTAELTLELRQLRAELSLHQSNAVAPEELAAEKQRHEATIRHLQEISKRLDEALRSPRAEAPDHQAPSTSHSRSSPGPGSSDFAMNIIRQSSLQQEQLQQQIRDLQSQLAKSRDEVAAKTAELEKIQHESAKKAQESSGAANSMLNSIGKIKEERDALKKQVDDLRIENAKLTAESHRLEELEKRLREQIQELNGRCADELKAHQTSQTAMAELRKEIDKLKQTSSLSKRREQELSKTIEELNKSFTTQESALKESIRLMEEERENAINWKRALYDQASSSTSTRMSDEDLDLSIMVDYQKKENDNLTKQLQLAKEQYFSTAAQLRTAQVKVTHLQEDLNASLQGRESSGDSSNWRTNYVEQHSILASTMELNSKLRHDLTSTQSEISGLKAALTAAEQKVEPLNQRIQELQQENLHVQQQYKVLKDQMDKWNVTQNTAENDSLKRQLAEVDTKIKNEKERLREMFSKQVKDKAAELNKQITAKNSEIVTLQSTLQGKDAEIAELNARSSNALRDMENSMRSLSEKSAEIARLREDMGRLQDDLAQKSEQILRQQAVIQQQRPELDEPNTESAPPAAAETSRPSSAAGIPAALPRPVQQPSPTHVSKSTAVVTPQTHGQPPLVQTQQRGRDPLPRGSNPPIVAVAPQAHEQGATTQTAAVAPHIVVAPHSSGASQQPALGVPLHADHSAPDPEASSSGIVPSTSHATAPMSTMGTVQGMQSRRRQNPDEESSSDTVSPERKRPRPIPGRQLQISLRPPSPTSSDVTSSTAPGTQSAVALPTSGTGETAPHRPRSRSSAGVQQPVEQNAGASSSQTIQEEVGFGDDGTGSGEERAVDSSENVAVGQEQEAMSGGDNAADVEADVMSSEEQDEDPMDADESGQAMTEPPFANAGEWPGATVTASDDTAQTSPQPMVSSEADYAEDQRQDENMEGTGGESLSDITSSETRPLTEEVPAPPLAASHSVALVSADTENRTRPPDVDASVGLEDKQEDDEKDVDTADMFSTNPVDLSESAFEEILQGAGSSAQTAAPSGSASTVSDIPAQSAETPATSVSDLSTGSGPPANRLNIRMRPPPGDIAPLRLTPRFPSALNSPPRQRLPRKPISPPTPNPSNTAAPRANPARPALGGGSYLPPPLREGQQRPRGQQGNRQPRPRQPGPKRQDPFS
ncbi:myosin-2 heavy chain-like [Paramacrobiotus metropolitanus]|uniref:myosin-2 heavy chain-like n=1 Tax=Paramacrobiotus metropolitanus TaxID=2943436 RepID=UPI002445CF69|nr:myosin-2 heavy chain-like [Paramacrobiotus metropolitanus]